MAGAPTETPGPRLAAWPNVRLTEAHISLSWCQPARPRPGLKPPGTIKLVSNSEVKPIREPPKPGHMCPGVAEAGD